MPRQLLVAAQAFFELIGERTHLVGVHGKLVPTLGQGDRMLDPLKQQAAKLVLKLFDLKRHRGLGIPQLLGGFGKAAQLGHVNERYEISQFHIYLSPSKISMIIIKTICLTNRKNYYIVAIRENQVPITTNSRLESRRILS